VFIQRRCNFLSDTKSGNVLHEAVGTYELLFRDFPRITSVSIADVPADIRQQNLQYTSQEVSCLQIFSVNETNIIQQTSVMEN